MTTKITLLHCTKEKEYLSDLLQNGLKFREHPVEFKLTKETGSWLIGKIMPILTHHVASLGLQFSKLSPENISTIMRGLGSISAQIPMICFTEVATGKDISPHGLKYGKYGLSIDRAWLESKGADRVTYIGDETEYSKLMALNLGTMRALSLQLNPQGGVIYNAQIFEMILDLFCFFEKRSNLEEQEFRIPGKHGFSGGETRTGSRLEIPIQKIETIFVAEESDVEEIEETLRSVSRVQDYNGTLPTVRVFPETKERNL